MLTISIVLGGPISRRTAGHRVLRHFETVRHDSHPHPARTRRPLGFPVCFLLFGVEKSGC